MGSRESAAVRYKFKIDHARQVERVPQWLGWTVAVLATASLVGFDGLWMAGRLSGGQAFGASLGTIIGSIMSGATAYGSGVNVGLGRSGSSWPRPLPPSLPATCRTLTSPRPATRELRRPVGGRDEVAQAGAGRPWPPARHPG